ncbi:MAG: type IV secretory system conjugative DNA transfer family protein [Candidatus Dadabacteria bacterium]|nr:MAG: type IV secretory system conjugative DNA transfer family protein [Candidatus Dadabacteria bacterium]
MNTTKVERHCILHPRESMSEGDAYLATSFESYRPDRFAEVLFGLHDRITKPFALEYFLKNQVTHLCFSGSPAVCDVLKALIYSMFSTCEIRPVNGPLVIDDQEVFVLTGTLTTRHGPTIPINNYQLFRMDILRPVLHVLSLLPPELTVLIQYVCKPLPDTALLHARFFIERWMYFILSLISPWCWLKDDYFKELREGTKWKIDAKQYRLVGKIHIVAPKEVDRSLCYQALEDILRAIKIADRTGFNCFTFKSIKELSECEDLFTGFSLADSRILSHKEVNALWHPVDLSHNNNLARISSRTLAPPGELLSYSASQYPVAVTHYRDRQICFDIDRSQRLKHLHVIGKSGVGKTCLMELLLKADFHQGYGVTIIDCHGDLIRESLQLIPEERADDIVLFDLVQSDKLPVFNPLVAISENAREAFIDNLIMIFAEGADEEWESDSKRLLRRTLQALYQSGRPTLVNAYLMIIDPVYREKFTRQLNSSDLKEFWREIGNASFMNISGAVTVVNSLSRLLSTNMLSVTMAQNKNAFDFRDIIRNKKILLVNLPKHNLGRRNVQFLGKLFMMLIQFSARELYGESGYNNTTNKHYIYLDEFQNFATQAAVNMFEEAHRLGLAVTVAHQNLEQIPDELMKQLMGAFGNLIVFRLSNADSLRVQEVFSGKIDSSDLEHLDHRNFYIKTSYGDKVCDPFSARTVDLNVSQDNLNQRYWAAIRGAYYTRRTELEKNFLDRLELR